MRHSFHLLFDTQHPAADYMRWPPDANGVELHDDLIAHMWAALTWAPCFYPQAGMRPAPHMDRYAVSVFRGSGAATLARVLEGYAAIFAAGPETLRLNCGIALVESPPKGHCVRYEEFPRDETITRLRQIASWAQQASIEGSGCYLAFKGI